MLDYLDNNPKVKEILHKIATGLTQFKDLKFTSLSKVASLNDIDFADSVNRKFPLHTKGDVALSNSFFSEIVGMPEYRNTPLPTKIKIAEQIKLAANLHGIVPTKRIDFLTAKNAEGVGYLEDFPSHVNRLAFKHFFMQRNAQEGISALAPLERKVILDKAAQLLGIKRKVAEKVPASADALKKAIAKDPIHWRALSTAQKLNIVKKSKFPARIDNVTTSGLKHRLVMAKQLENPDIVRTLIALLAELTSGHIPVTNTPNSVVQDAIETLLSMDNEMNISPLNYTMPDPAELFYHNDLPPIPPAPIFNKLIALRPTLRSALSGILGDDDLDQMDSDPQGFIHNINPVAKIIIMRITKSASQDFEPLIYDI